MTYEEKRKWLQRYSAARQLFEFRRQQLETAKTDAGRTTQNISPVPGGHSDGQALPRAVERIQEAEQRVVAQARICDEIREDITENTSASRAGAPSSAILIYPKVRCWRITGGQSRACN